MKRNLKREYKLFEGYDSIHNKTDYVITKFKLDEAKMNELVNEKDYYELCDYFEIRPQVLRQILNRYNILKTRTHCRHCNNLYLEPVKSYGMLGCSEECCKKLYDEYIDKQPKELNNSTKEKISESVMSNYREKYGDLWYNFKYDQEFRYYKLEELKEKYGRKLHVSEIAAELGLSVNSIRHELTKEEYDEYVYRKYYNMKESSLEKALSSLGFKYNCHREFSLAFSDGKIKFPDYYNEEQQVVLEFNGEFWHKDLSEYKRFGVVERNIVQEYNWMHEYNSKGYKLCVLWENDLEDFLQNVPKNIDELLERYEVKKKYDFYVAGPFFNEEQLESMSKIESILEKHNKTMFRPRFDAGKIDLANATSYECYQTFKNDTLGIIMSKTILANTTYKDSGTSVEIGYASLVDHTDIWLINDIETSGRKVNLMLAQAADNSFSSYSELDEYLSKDTDEAFVSQFEIE